METGVHPFRYWVIDGFLQEDYARKLEAEFPAYGDPRWLHYDNAVENKKTMDRWEYFGPQVSHYLLAASTGSVALTIAQTVREQVVSDVSLRGAGLHVHGSGGFLNHHLDYDIHPKLGLKRKYNLLVYLSSDYKPEYGGKLGFWSGTSKYPLQLEKEIEPKFNRAVLFDASGNAWHGLSSPFDAPGGIVRKSIAMYYLTMPDGTEKRKRALFAPREDQKDDASVAEFCEERAK